MIKALLSTALMLAAASSAIAQEMAAPMSSRMEGAGYPPAGTSASGMLSARAHAFSRLQAALRDLRRQALALREADGGALTPEHLALIQTRLDSAQAAYRPYQHAPW